MLSNIFGHPPNMCVSCRCHNGHLVFVFLMLQCSWYDIKGKNEEIDHLMVHLHGRGGKTPQGFGAAHCTHISIGLMVIISLLSFLSIFIFLVTIWGGNAGVTRREGCLCQIVNPSYSRSYQGLTILSDTLACLESTMEIINSISQWVTQRNMLQNTVIWFLTRYCMLFINMV